MPKPMTAAFANLILSKPFGFITESDIPDIIRHDRLCWLLIRCGAQHGRFSAPAQNCAQLIATIEATGDWIRDVSFPAHTIEEARAFVEALPRAVTSPGITGTVHVNTRGEAVLTTAQLAEHERNLKRRHQQLAFDESQCSGAFDGFTVTTDAEGNL